MDNLKAKYNKNPLRGDIYNLSELKIILDDVIRDFMENVGNSKQSKVSTDIKIAIGLISTVIASAVAYFSLTSEFEYHKQVITILTLIYFVINILGEIYFRWTGSSMVFKDRVVSTSVSAPDPTYVIMVYNKNKLIPSKYTKSMFDLFDSNGRLIHEEFLDDLQGLLKSK
ncbi:Microsomal signal peptidase subunit SPC25-like protein [Encephalitozoon intestinalis ATCC 50506]|uniref:Signal peptidase complex subunit 2 n=1 Tax=Encephalitozoon intestinalis (strain ATCC 50506) TaxID=876142 RepID=E0S5X2_ENCIT|nr:Microsomal signal peptidase subunit SPC25-like protein [Encephalitozoon intestinalis ATCC 50506]ADM11107.2 Microsomal signal peptidase subunit SPC25-like protein [Encephalitozoon intestinalis ATCC 50506]UTX44761.1 microsomal signal peptidase subunit SPC25 [Encephalitozoon intestinalis]